MILAGDRVGSGCHMHEHVQVRSVDAASWRGQSSARRELVGATWCSRACSAICSADMCPPAPPAKQIGRFRPAASANIRSTPAAQAGKAQISGTHAADAIGRRTRYPHVGWLVWATGRGSITRSAMETAPTLDCSPRAALSTRR
jgi:hypothetical protein